MADPSKATIRINESDKERLKEMADATGRHVADVVAELLREPAYVCPECSDPFDPEEVDPETVEEHGLMTNAANQLVRGERTVKSFECPCCESRVSPEQVKAADVAQGEAATRSDIGLTADGSGTSESGQSEESE